VTLSLAGYYFNQIAFVRTHFQLVVLAIIVISLIPAVVQALRTRAHDKSAGFEPASLGGDETH
jgi:membrane-associated protein